MRPRYQLVEVEGIGYAVRDAMTLRHLTFDQWRGNPPDWFVPAIG